MTRRERLEGAVQWTAKDITRAEVVEGIITTLEEREGKRFPTGRGLKLPYTRDDLNPDEAFTVRCAICPGWYRVTRRKFKDDIFSSHIASQRHLNSIEKRRAE